MNIQECYGNEKTFVGAGGGFSCPWKLIFRGGWELHPPLQKLFKSKNSKTH